MRSGRPTRREFVLDAALIGVALPVLGPGMRLGSVRGRPAHSEPLRIGVALPEGGVPALIAESVAEGTALGMAEGNRIAEALGRRFELVEAHFAAPADAAGTARRLVEAQGAMAVVGGLDPEGCGELAAAVTGHGALFFNVGCADDALRARCNPLAFHFEASLAMYADAVAEWATGQAGLGRWHFVAGETKRGDAALRRARTALLDRGGEDAGTSRLGRLADPTPVLAAARRSGAQLVFLCASDSAREAFLTCYAAERSVPFEVACVPGGTARLGAASPASRAGIWPTLWHHKLFRYGAEQLDARFRARAGRSLNDRAWAGWMAVKTLVEAVLRADTADPRALARHLEGRVAQFDGHKGRRLSFRPWDHQLRQPLYLVRAKPGAVGAEELFEAVAELPRGEPGAGLSSAEYLDRLGDRDATVPCGGSDA